MLVSKDNLYAFTLHYSQQNVNKVSLYQSPITFSSVFGVNNNILPYNPPTTEGFQALNTIWPNTMVFNHDESFIWLTDASFYVWNYEISTGKLYFSNFQFASTCYSQSYSSVIISTSMTPDDNYMVVSCTTALYLVNLQSWTSTQIFSYASAVGIANNAFHPDYIIIQDQANGRLVSYQISTGSTTTLSSDPLFSKTRLNLIVTPPCSVNKNIRFMVFRRWDSISYVDVDVSSTSPCTTCPVWYNRTACKDLDFGSCFPCIFCGPASYTSDCSATNVQSSVTVEPSMSAAPTHSGGRAPPFP
ncbi:hypothetical protein GUITHDRAFT_146721 [Guillardia theta CCMP2712]|uniref:Uncharacterized protein n=1 Tax=Guillardia theta (strain CCMP2712) TaxID=905079 RepID=L1IGT4_GUITC|nr:hypothetical protein GUITHDRAFT_146721 [Guillardia theta CCMP2712]EKX35139.1 hypothetical protein GUITHDRAFT_146721 [Guillardia theta CCMP2712]|eukprot:XP_005822119.1 hypothetical protein GUITHDRAFT_146721 [Guillardia theta CCMP2712]